MIPRCLHCALRDVVKEHARTYGHHSNGKVVVDVSEVCTDVGVLVAEFIMQAPPDMRARWLDYAKECLEAGLRFAETGIPQAVTTPTVDTH